MSARFLEKLGFLHRLPDCGLTASDADVVRAARASARGRRFAEEGLEGQIFWSAGDSTTFEMGTRVFANAS